MKTKSRYFQQTPVIVTDESLAGATSKHATMGYAVGIYPGTGSLLVPGERDDQQVISMTWPIQDNPTYNSSDYQTKRQVYEYVSSSFDTDIGTTYTRLRYYTGSDGNVVMSKYHYVYDLEPGNWYLAYRDLQPDMWYKGTINTRETVIDEKDVVEILYTNPNKLKTTDQGPSKITVE